MLEDRLTGMNYYELLGVSPSASGQEIRDAYRDMLRIFHPDSSFYSDIIDDRPGTRHVDTFMRISAAYEVLKNPNRRERYDSSIRRPLEQRSDPVGMQPDSLSEVPAGTRSRLAGILNTPYAPVAGLILGALVTAFVLRLFA